MKPLMEFCAEWRQKEPRNDFDMSHLAYRACADALEARLREIAAEISTNDTMTTLFAQICILGVSNLSEEQWQKLYKEHVSPPPEKGEK